MTRSLPLLPAVLLACGLASSCDPAVEARSWPEGTVVAVGEQPISSAEVDRHLEAMGALDPAYTQPHRRRLALVEVEMPLAFGRSQASEEERAAARAEAESWEARRLAGELSGPRVAATVGTWADLGMDVWLVARELEPGEASGVVELPGRFAVVEVQERDHDPYAGKERFGVRVESFWYASDLPTLTTEMLEGTLEIVDPAWDPIVPGFWKHRMRGEL